MKTIKGHQYKSRPKRGDLNGRMHDIYHYVIKVIKKDKDSVLLITSGDTNTSILSLFDRNFGFLVLPLENLIKE
jgi:hypothetical protein